MTRSTAARSASRLGAMLVGAALLTGLIGLSACSAGQVTQTDTQVPAVPGVNVNSVDGQIAVRNALIVYKSSYPADATMPLDLRLFNNSPTPVRLTGAAVNDENGGRVVLIGGASASPSPSPSAPASASPSVSGSKKPSGSPSASAPGSPAAAPSPTAIGSSKIDIALPPNASGPQALSPTAGGSYLAIVGRSKELRAGETTGITLTFTYEGGATTTVSFIVPVGTPLSPPPRESPTFQVGL